MGPAPTEVVGLVLFQWRLLARDNSSGGPYSCLLWWRLLAQVCSHRCLWFRPAPMEVPNIGLMWWKSLSRACSCGSVNVFVLGLIPWRFLAQPWAHRGLWLGHALLVDLPSYLHLLWWRALDQACSSEGPVLRSNVDEDVRPIAQTKHGQSCLHKFSD